MNNEKQIELTKYQSKVNVFLNKCACGMSEPSFDFEALVAQSHINKNIQSAVRSLGFASFVKVNGVKVWTWNTSNFITLDMINQIISKLQSYGAKNEADKESKKEREENDFAPFNFDKMTDQLNNIERRLTRFENNQEKIISLLKKLAPQAELFTKVDKV